MGVCTILIGTRNRAKQRSINNVIAELPIRILLPDQIQGMPHNVEELESSHLGNARSKAIVWSRWFHGLTIATDGGFLIPGLGCHWDSLNTKRFAGNMAGDPERIERLLGLLKKYSNLDRRAQLVEAVAIGYDGTLVDSWEAVSTMGWLNECYGRDQPIDGFWISAMWSFPALGKSYRDLSLEEKCLVADPWVILKPQIQNSIMSLINRS
jgi:inosine/xanthosine triphosphate pyrophosphatase family protein